MIRTQRISIKDIVWLVISNLVIWQNALLKVSSVFKYTDELLTLFFVFVIVLNIWNLRSDHIKLLLLLSALLILGVLGNLSSGIPRHFFAIILDILYFSKIHICLIGASLFFDQKGRLDSMSGILATEVRIITAIALVLAILSQFIDLGMTHGQRYGIKAFQFVYSGPGMLSQYGVLFLIILAVDLNNKGNKIVKYCFIAMLFIMWASTVRARGLAVILVWILFMIISNSSGIKNSGNKTKTKIIHTIFKPHYIAVAIVGLFLVGFSQFQHYLGGNSQTARSLLLKGGIAAMSDYFPLGAGFATFGTEMAAKYYSPLYYKYGLNTHWALKEGGSELTDCFWPAVGAEFGFFGILLMALIVYLFCSMMYKLSKPSRYSAVAVLTYIAYLLISSIATSIFTAYTTTGFVVLIVGMVIDSHYNTKRNAEASCLETD